MTTTIFAAKVAAFKGETAKADVNELMPVILVPIAGTCPHKRVLSGTSADMLGLSEDSVYLFSYTEGEKTEEHGTAINYTVLAELSTNPMDIIQISRELGKAEIIEIP